MFYPEFREQCARHYARQARNIWLIPLLERVGFVFYVLAVASGVLSVASVVYVLAVHGAVSPLYWIPTALLCACFFLFVPAFALMNEAEMRKQHG